MAKLTLNNLTTMTSEAVTPINNNFDAIEAAVENTLSRDGTSPNQMGADIDLNNNDLLNVGTLNTDTLVLDGTQVVAGFTEVLDGDYGDIVVSGANTVWTVEPTLITTATQTALDLKAPIESPTFTGTVSGIDKTMVGLSNVNNTADTAKPISTAQQTALDLKAPIASPTFTGTVSGITKTMVGLGNVDNTTDAAKPVSTATQTALNLKANLAGPTFSGIVTTAGQIKFPTTANPSSDVNTLDDYEEGTSAPTVTAASGTITSYSSTLNYVKIGKAVFFNAQITITNAGTGGGSLSFTLPFTPSGVGSVFGRREGVVGNGLIGQISGSSMSVFLYDGTSPIATNADLRICGFFFTAS